MRREKNKLIPEVIKSGNEKEITSPRLSAHTML